MADRVKPIGSRQGAGFRPGSIVGAVLFCIALLAIFDLLSHTNF